jgi:hypothetical protein
VHKLLLLVELLIVVPVMSDQFNDIECPASRFLQIQVPLEDGGNVVLELVNVTASQCSLQPTSSASSLTLAVNTICVLLLLFIHISVLFIVRWR